MCLLGSCSSSSLREMGREPNLCKPPAQSVSYHWVTHWVVSNNQEKIFFGCWWWKWVVLEASVLREAQSRNILYFFVICSVTDAATTIQIWTSCSHCHKLHSYKDNNLFSSDKSMMSWPCCLHSTPYRVTLCNTFRSHLWISDQL